MYQEYVRSFTCWSCVNRGECKSTKKLGHPDKCFCNETHRWGSLERGHYCSKFVNANTEEMLADDGIPIKNMQPLDYRTANQWEEHGRKIKAAAEGKVMHPKANSRQTYVYYLIEDTEN